MKFKRKYKDLNDTLKHIKVQVVESIPFALREVPDFDSVEDLFYWLKKKTRYKSDPPKVELLQTMPTLFRGDFWGVPGMGDCDCFVITTLASMISLQWEDIYIALVGRKREVPVHIYTVIYVNGERFVFDLTNKEFNHERDGYNYIQEVPVPWHKWKGLHSLTKK